MCDHCAVTQLKGNHMATKKYPNDTSGKLFDTIAKEHGCKNENEIAILTEMRNDSLSKIRHGKMNVSAAIILMLSKNSAVGKTVAQIEKLIGAA
jgi:glucose-6-phosphate dehydrogenase assembly protein OpcA